MCFFVWNFSPQTHSRYFFTLTSRSRDDISFWFPHWLFSLSKKHPEPQKRAPRCAIGPSKELEFHLLRHSFRQLVPLLIFPPNIKFCRGLRDQSFFIWPKQEGLCFHLVQCDDRACEPAMGTRVQQIWNRNIFRQLYLTLGSCDLWDGGRKKSLKDGADSPRI